MQALHLKNARIHPEVYPDRSRYPFNLPVFRDDQTITFESPVTLFVGENGTGKSTLLEAISRACRIHIWRDNGKQRFHPNPYREAFHACLSVEWYADSVTGFFFGSDIFRYFAQVLDEWAAHDPGQLEYFGGQSLMDLSHGQSIMAFFRSCFRREGLYLLDEPETALSPRTQLELLHTIETAPADSMAQFIIATHSPILMACAGAALYSFDGSRIQRTTYEETAHYRVYRDFLEQKRSELLRNRA
jgi:predicted ATPase